MKFRPIFIYLPYIKAGQHDLDTSLFYHGPHGWIPCFKEWLLEHFGPFNEHIPLRNGRRWTLLHYCPDPKYGQGYCLILRDRVDATLFKLAWGGIISG